MKIATHAALRRVQSFLDRTQQVTGALAGFKDLNLVSGIGLLAQLARLGTEALGTDIMELSKDWKQITLPPEAVPLVQSFCTPHREMGGDRWDLYRIGGQGVLFLHPEYGDTLFRVEFDSETFLYQVREGLWTRHGTRLHVDPKPISNWSVVFQLHEDTSRLALPSERASQVWERVSPFLKKGITRSLLLDGRPGTGKTTISQYLVNKASELLPGARVLRIPTGDFAFISSRMLQGLIRVLQPQVLVIDDFDRIVDMESLLDFLESCRQHVKLFVVTTNHLERLPHAVTRPGRFDEIQIIEGLGETFVREFLGPLWDSLSEEQRTLVLPWPVAFLEELRSRISMLPQANVAAELEDLRVRVEKKEIPWWLKPDKDEKSKAPVAAA